MRLGCEISDKLAAIAPVIANIPENIIGTCRPESPLPVLLMNGTEDPLLSWGGGSVGFLGKTMGEVVSTADTVSFRVQHNHCSSVPHVEVLADTDSNDDSSLTVSTYGNCQNNAAVVLSTITGGGHSFPGGISRTERDSREERAMLSTPRKLSGTSSGHTADKPRESPGQNAVSITCQDLHKAKMLACPRFFD